MPAVFALEAYPEEIALDKLTKGGYADKQLVLKNDGKIGVSIKAAGEMENWITLPKGIFYVEGIYRILFSINVPNDALFGQHEGIIVITTYAGNEITGVITETKQIKIRANVVAEEIRKVNVKDVYISNAGVNNPVQVLTTLSNEGNVVVSPMISASLADFSGNVIKSSSASISILPTKTETQTLFIDTNLVPPGQYVVETNIYLAEKVIEQHRKTITIFLDNQTREEGAFVEIKLEPVVEVNQTNTGKAIFRNTGKVPVRAYFRGILKTENPQVVVGEEKVVGAGEQAELPFSFKVEEKGVMPITGLVVYNDKYTDTKETKFDSVEKLDEIEIPMATNMLLISILGIIAAYYAWHLKKKIRDKKSQ